MKLVRINILFVITMIFCIFNSLNTVVLADDNGSSIFSLDKDGYWKPADSVSHQFVLENIWNEEGYLDYLRFNKSYIEDMKTLKNYTVEDAIQKGIIADYTIIIALDDPKIGKIELYKGRLKDLDGVKINLKNKIYMKLDSKVIFRISIYFDKNASNEYQNKSYKYIIQPSAYKINDSNNQKGTIIINHPGGIVLIEGYTYGDDGYIYDIKGDRYTEQQYLDKISKMNKVSILFKTGDFNMALGFETIVLLILSFILMVVVKRRHI